MAVTPLWLRVRAVAYAFRDMTEQPPGTNRGQVVDRFIMFVGLNPEEHLPWCMAFVYYVGYFGLYDPVSQKSAWPLPRTAGCAALGAFAEKRGLLRPPTEAESGDVFLVWYTFRDKAGKITEQRFGHTGFLISKNADGSWVTLEANTTKPGDNDPKTMREGWGVFQRVRTLKAADRVVRWSDMV